MTLGAGISVVASGRPGSHISDPYDCDVYMVDTGEGLVLIDAGVGPAGDEPLRAVREAGHSLGDVKLILLTHGHADHAGNAAYLREKTGAKVMAHALCAGYVSAGDARAIALDGALAAGLYPAGYRFRPCPVEPLGDGDVIRMGGVRFTAIDTPGHCSGHMCYLMERDGTRYLFAGDSIFVGGRITLQNIWDCSITDYAATAQRLCGMDFDALLPAHFGIDMRDGRAHVRRAAEIFMALQVPPQAGR